MDIYLLTCLFTYLKRRDPSQTATCVVSSPRRRACLLQEQAARVAQAELEARMNEAKLKDDEVRRVQLELQDARTLMEQNQKALQDVMSAHARAEEDDMNSSEQSTLRPQTYKQNSLSIYRSVVTSVAVVIWNGDALWRQRV